VQTVWFLKKRKIFSTGGVHSYSKQDNARRRDVNFVLA
jgi:hypothetical protein